MVKKEFGFYVLSKDKKEYYFEYYYLDKGFNGREFTVDLGDRQIIEKIEPKSGVILNENNELFYYFNHKKVD